MSKYIDAEKLKAFVQKGFDRAKESEEYDDDMYETGRADAYEDIIHIIDSLQQGQPKSKLVKVRCVSPFDETWEKNKIYICEVWHHGDLNRNFWDVYYDYGKDPKYVQFSTIELLNVEFAIIQEESQVKQEQPEVDLGKEIIRFQREDMDRDTTVGDVARHFYKLGLNARKEE